MGEALTKIDVDSKKGYSALMAFVDEARRERNKAVHKGQHYTIVEKLPHTCINSVDTLLALFVDLHNVYIAKVMV